MPRRRARTAPPLRIVAAMHAHRDFVTRLDHSGWWIIDRNNNVTYPLGGAAVLPRSPRLPPRATENQEKRADALEMNSEEGASQDEKKMDVEDQDTIRGRKEQEQDEEEGSSDTDSSSSDDDVLDSDTRNETTADALTSELERVTLPSPSTTNLAIRNHTLLGSHNISTQLFKVREGVADRLRARIENALRDTDNSDLPTLEEDSGKKSATGPMENTNPTNINAYALQSGRVALQSGTKVDVEVPPPTPIGAKHGPKTPFEAESTGAPLNTRSAFIEHVGRLTETVNVRRNLQAHVQLLRDQVAASEAKIAELDAEMMLQKICVKFLESGDVYGRMEDIENPPNGNRETVAERSRATISVYQLFFAVMGTEEGRARVEQAYRIWLRLATVRDEDDEDLEVDPGLVDRMRGVIEECLLNGVI